MPFLFDDKSGDVVMLCGSVGVQTLNAYESKSAMFDGVNGYLLIGKSFDLYTGDFTIELRFRPSNVSITQTLFDLRPNIGGVYPVYIYAVNTGLRFRTASSDRITGGTIALNTWHHISVCRSAGVTRMFLDGVQVGVDYVDTTDYLTNNVVIGANRTSSLFCNGMIDHVRVTKFARYTGAFTPPTTMDNTDSQWNDVVFLVKFDGAIQTHHVGYPAIDNAIDLTNFYYQTPQPFTTPRRLAGVVKENGVAVGAGKRVVAMTRGTLEYVGSCTTKSDGSFEMTGLEDRTGNPEKLFVVAFDDDGVNPNYNAVIADQVEQEV